MKEMIKEIRKSRALRYSAPQLDSTLHDARFFDALSNGLLAVMERIDAMEQPPRVAWVESVCADGRALTQIDIDRARRDGRIEALRWAWKNATCSHTLCSSTRIINDAITRIENGGEL